MLNVFWLTISKLNVSVSCQHAETVAKLIATVVLLPENLFGYAASAARGKAVTTPTAVTQHPLRDLCPTEEISHAAGDGYCGRGHAVFGYVGRHMADPDEHAGPGHSYPCPRRRSRGAAGSQHSH
jgi:hypothetical protein